MAKNSRSSAFRLVAIAAIVFSVASVPVYAGTYLTWTEYTDDTLATTVGTGSISNGCSGNLNNGESTICPFVATTSHFDVLGLLVAGNVDGFQSSFTMFAKVTSLDATPGVVQLRSIILDTPTVPVAEEDWVGEVRLDGAFTTPATSANYIYSQVQYPTYFSGNILPSLTIEADGSGSASAPWYANNRFPDGISPNGMTWDVSNYFVFASGISTGDVEDIPFSGSISSAPEPGTFLVAAFGLAAVVRRRFQ